MIWNLETGELFREIDLIGILSWSKDLIWIDENFLLLADKHLLDVEKQIQLWSYKNAFGAMGGAGYGWFFVSKFGNRIPGLAGSPIPHGPAQTALQTAMQDGGYFIMKPGSEVTVDASGISDGLKAAEAKKDVETRLANAGYIIVPRAAVTVKLSVTRGKQQEVTYHSFGAAFSDQTKFQFTPYVTSLKFEFKGEDHSGTLQREFCSPSPASFTGSIDRGRYSKIRKA